MTVRQMLTTLDSREIAEQLAYDLASNPEWRKRNEKVSAIKEYEDFKHRGGTWDSGDVKGNF